jgi:hypothetical protein
MSDRNAPGRPAWRSQTLTTFRMEDLRPGGSWLIPGDPLPALGSAAMSPGETAVYLETCHAPPGVT